MTQQPADNSTAHQKYTAAAGTAVVAGAFSAVVAVILTISIFQTNAADPLDNDTLRQLKADLAANPDAVPVQDAIRALDEQLRRQYFRRQQLAHVGAYLLLCGSAAFAASALWAAACRKKLPMPAAGSEGSALRAAAVARWSVAALAAVLAAGAGLTAAWVPQAGERKPAAPPASAGSVALAPAGDANTPQSWPRFRGPAGGGVCRFTKIPTQWNGSTGQNILWKTPVPLEGLNSPIVWANRVFLTGATKDKQEVYCFNAQTGELLWRRPVRPAGAPADPVTVSDDTGYAAPTAVTDGKRVCAIFASGDMAAFDFDGKELWSKNLGRINNTYGYASSLEMFGDVVIAQIDQDKSDEDDSGGNKSDQASSRLVALNADKGTVAWEVPRPVKGSWTSPILIAMAGGPQIIASGNPFIIAHDPVDGSEIWQAELMSEDSAPSPIFAGGLVMGINPTATTLFAIRPDGKGDVTQTHVAWKLDTAVPDVTSPLSDGERLWTLRTGGELTCYDANSGRQVYQKDLNLDFCASPSLADGRLYLLAKNGTMVIAAAEGQFEEIGRCELGEEVQASPAFIEGRIFIRTKSNLYCIGAK